MLNLVVCYLSCVVAILLNSCAPMLQKNSVEEATA